MISLVDLLLENTNKPKAIIMAGGAGVGKTFVTDKFKKAAKSKGWVILNPDQYARNPNPKQRLSLAAASSKINKEVDNLVKSKDKPNIIWDTTANNPTKVKELQDAGYDVLMIMVYAHPSVAFEQNFARASKEGEDSLPPYVILKTWASSYNDPHIENYQKMFGDNFIIIDNTSKPGVDNSKIEAFNKAAQQGGKALEKYIGDIINSDPEYYSSTQMISKPVNLSKDQQNDFDSKVQELGLKLEKEDKEAMEKLYQKYFEKNNEVIPLRKVGRKNGMEEVYKSYMSKKVKKDTEKLKIYNDISASIKNIGKLFVSIDDATSKAMAHIGSKKLNELANFLVENILNEEVNPITALFGGGFKPPTAGHLEVVKKAINNNPEIDKVIIYVGGKARNGVTQDQAIKIWDKFYKPQINKPVEILSSVAPVKDIYRYAKNNPEETVYWVIGAREGREDDLKDIASRSISIDKYPNLQLKTTSTPDGGMSGTNARKAIVNNNFKEFERYLPDTVDKNAIWDILTKQELNESYVTIDMSKVNKALRKGMGHEKETDENIIAILDAHPNGNIPHPVFLDHYAKFDKYFGEEDDNRILDETGLEHLLVNVLNLPSKDVLIVMNDYQKGNKDLEDVNWFEKYDELHQDDEEWNPVGGEKFDDSKDNLKSVNKYLAKNKKLHEADPKKGTGKKPKGSGRRLYTDEDPSDTVKVKFSSRQDIVDTLNKKSFKAKSHARQSQVINLIHQRVRAAYNRAKDPDVKRRLKTALDYAEKRKEASKKKTQRLKKENIDPKAQAKHKGKAAPFGSAYEPVKEKKSGGRSTRYRAIEKRGNQYYYIQDNPFSPGIRQEFGPYKTKEAALKKMGTFPPASNYRDITEKDIKETGLKIAKKNMDDYKRSNNPSGKKPKDPFGLNQFARELMKEEDSFDAFDYPKHLKLYTQYMLDQGMDIRPLPKVKFINDDVENAKEFLGKTAYYDPTNRLIVLYTLNRHPKDVMRSFSHEMIHHLQNNQNRLGRVVTTNTTQDDHVDNLEKEANLLGTMTFRHWTDTLTESVLKEGRYDRISNEISSNIFNYWKKDFEAGKEASRYFDNVNNELDIDIDANITFLPNSEKLTIDGGAEEAAENGESAYLEVRFEVDPEMLPEFWEEISMNLKDVVRHEIEHITQSGYSAAGGYKKVYKKVDGKWKETNKYEWQGKDFDDDQVLRDMIDMELLPKAQYFKLAKEIDANLQGMYFRAKKEKRPFGDIINNYLDAQDITAKEKEEILDLWRSRNKVLNLPQF